MKSPGTLTQARERYLNRATLKSPHTVLAYGRAIDLFLEFLGDKSEGRGLPIQETAFVSPGETPLAKLSADDAPIFLHFAEWMLTPDLASGRPYKPATVRLRLAGVQRWFQFLDDYIWLPPEFPLAKARRLVKDELRGHPRHHTAPQPPQGMAELVYFYEQLTLPARLQGPRVTEASIRRWELARLRNNALIRCLAESGGRISEVLSLNVENFPPRALLDGDQVIRVQIVGKGGHPYDLRFLDALPAIRAYLQARGADMRTSGGHIPLFVGHTSASDGQRISRVTAWRVVQDAARALGLGKISPHDFRHWRATQLINAGQPLDVVQDFLGHRSVETTRAFYARTDPRRVDAVAQETRLPKPGQEEKGG